MLSKGVPIMCGMIEAKLIKADSNKKKTRKGWSKSGFVREFWIKMIYFYYW